MQGQLHYGLLLEVLLVDKIFGLLLETLHSGVASHQLGPWLTQGCCWRRRNGERLLFKALNLNVLLESHSNHRKVCTAKHRPAKGQRAEGAKLGLSPSSELSLNT